MVALYSWSLVSSSSPGSNRSDCRIVLTPVVAFGTNARPSGSASRNRPIAARAVVEQLRQVEVEEADRLGLHPVAQGPLVGEHRFGAGPE